MKSSENKIIADKLESLDSLPEGYQPDLNSKWALLEETMNERESAGIRVNKKWMNIAACLVVFVTSVMLWIYMQRTVTITLNQPVKTEPSKTIVIKNIPENSLPQNGKVAHPKSMKSHTEDPVENKVNVPPAEDLAIVPEVIPLLKDSSVNEVEKIIQPVLTAKIPAKLKKQRYVEVDFDDPINTVYIPANKSTFGQPFRIKLGLEPSGNSDKYSKGTDEIKLRQTF